MDTETIRRRTGILDRKEPASGRGKGIPGFLKDGQRAEVENSR